MALTSGPGPLLPPGGLFEIVFSFDTTGSMSRAIEEVKGRLQDMIQRLQADIPGIRIGVIAHGDYCDKDVFYLEKHVDLTSDVAELCGFVQEVEGTGGGDPEECYEYILHMVSGFDWTPGSQRALVLIADSAPHGPDYELNVDNLDWRKEAEELARKGIKVYGVQAFDNADSTAFFQELVAMTMGQHVQLGQFSNICDFIMAICYRERGEDFLEGYEAEVRARQRRMDKDLEGLFGTLRRGDSSASHVSGHSVTPGISALTCNGSSASCNSNAPINLTKSASVRSNSSRMGCANMAPPVGVVSPVTATLSVTTVRKVPVKAACKQQMNGALKTPVIHGIKNVKKNQKSKLTSSAAKSDVLNKSLRHNVKETDFILSKGNLKNRWSKWKLAITDTEPKSTRNWIKRSDSGRLAAGKLGWRRKELFPWQSSNVRVLHEVAVQARKRGKLHVVYSKWSTLSADPTTWEKRLLCNKQVKDNIDKALRQQCKVFVRRFVGRGLGRNQRDSLRAYRGLYRYAWPEYSDHITATGTDMEVSF